MVKTKQANDKKIFANNALARKTPLGDLRNIAIAIHIEAGNTTMKECISSYSGILHKTGEVHESPAVTHWMAQQREREVTIPSRAIR
jgi:elongation factor G